MHFDPEHFQVLRARRGLTREELAKLADLSPSLITLIEQGKRTPGPKTIDKIAHGLRCEREALFSLGQPTAADEAVA